VGLPMAVATVVEEIQGVRRYQVLQTAIDVLTIRLDHDPATDRGEVWQRVHAGLAKLLRANDCDGISLCLAAEPPQTNPRSGKLRHVLRSMPSGG
jgi:phenylacetate-CoA ligase